MPILIALFDCGCEYEASPHYTVMVWGSDKELDSAIKKLKVQSPYDQCEPAGYTEYYITSDILRWSNNSSILPYEHFNRMWAERYIIGMVYRYWHSGTVTIPKWAVERWTRQMNAEYKDLPDDEKESDRAEADKVIDCLHTWATVVDNSQEA
ncbi:MAG: hypothetical protein E3J94_03065 [Desulfobacteraceae bacterium]|nr:MAG: hypothetical protein E3J94_03065 [Desulfobacteraceae bacterium]